MPIDVAAIHREHVEAFRSLAPLDGGSG